MEYARRVAYASEIVHWTLSGWNSLDAEIPKSFKQGMREIARGEVIELDEALEELEQPQ